MTRRVRCCMSCAGLSWWGKKGGNMKLSDYLKNIDNLDEKMEVIKDLKSKGEFFWKGFIIGCIIGIGIVLLMLLS